MCVGGSGVSARSFFQICVGGSGSLPYQGSVPSFSVASLPRVSVKRGHLVLCVGSGAAGGDVLIWPSFNPSEGASLGDQLRSRVGALARGSQRRCVPAATSVNSQDSEDGAKEGKESTDKIDEKDEKDSESEALYAHYGPVRVVLRLSRTLHANHIIGPYVPASRVPGMPTAATGSRLGEGDDDKTSASAGEVHELYMGQAHPDTSLTLMLSMLPDTAPTPSASASSAAAAPTTPTQQGRAYVQMVVYGHPGVQVSTFGVTITDSMTRFARSVDAEVLAVVLAKQAVLKARKSEPSHSQYMQVGPTRGVCSRLLLWLCI